MGANDRGVRRDLVSRLSVLRPCADLGADLSGDGGISRQRRGDTGADHGSAVRGGKGCRHRCRDRRGRTRHRDWRARCIARCCSSGAKVKFSAVTARSSRPSTNARCGAMAMPWACEPMHGRTDGSADSIVGNTTRCCRATRWQPRVRKSTSRRRRDESRCRRRRRRRRYGRVSCCCRAPLPRRPGVMSSRSAAAGCMPRRRSVIGRSRRSNIPATATLSIPAARSSRGLPRARLS